MTPLSTLLLLITAIQVECLVVTSKVELPEPPAMDSSLSPQLVKAFYEINFVPLQEKGIQTKLGDATVEMKDKTCHYSKEFCKYFHFATSKVAAVQKVDDMIHKALLQGEVPVVTGYGAPESQVSALFKEINQTVNKKIPIASNKTSIADAEVPVYKGVVDTKAVLERTENPAVIYRSHERPYYPPRPYFPDKRPYYDTYRGPPPCIQSPCVHPWFEPVHADIGK